MDDYKQQAPPSLHSSSNTYFTQQALQAGYVKPSEIDCWTLADLRAAILREMAKERIRQQTIAAEIARLRAAAAAAEELRRGNDRHSFPFIPLSSAAEMTLEERVGRLAAARREGFRRTAPFR